MWQHVVERHVPLYDINSLATVVKDPDIYRLLTFQVQNLISLFHCLHRIKGLVQVRATCIRIVRD